MIVASRKRLCRRLFGIAPALLAATIAAHRVEAQVSKVPLDVNAVGCISQTQDTAAAPPTGHEQGAAKGLTLSRATIKLADGRAVGAAPRSAVRDRCLPATDRAAPTPQPAAHRCRWSSRSGWWARSPRS